METRISEGTPVESVFAAIAHHEDPLHFGFATGWLVHACRHPASESGVPRGDVGTCLRHGCGSCCAAWVQPMNIPISFPILSGSGSSPRSSTATMRIPQAKRSSSIPIANGVPSSRCWPSCFPGESHLLRPEPAHGFWIVSNGAFRGSPFLRAKMFPAEAGDNVYTRAEYMLKKGLLAAPLQALRQAWYGEQAHRVIAIRYDSLTTQPVEVIARLYELLGQAPFPHDFEGLEYDEPEFDAQLGICPGLHRVGRSRRRPITAPPFCLPTYLIKTTAASGMFPARTRAV